MAATLTDYNLISSLSQAFLIWDSHLFYHLFLQKTHLAGYRCDKLFDAELLE
jgi:hypothetical protein